MTGGVILPLLRVALRRRGYLETLRSACENDHTPRDTSNRGTQAARGCCRGSRSFALSGVAPPDAAAACLRQQHPSPESRSAVSSSLGAHSMLMEQWVFLGETESGSQKEPPCRRLYAVLVRSRKTLRSSQRQWKAARFPISLAMGVKGQRRSRGARRGRYREASGCFVDGGRRSNSDAKGEIVP